jgi:hypothetical protein
MRVIGPKMADFIPQYGIYSKAHPKGWACPSPNFYASFFGGAARVS